jgi:hypothetical protein
VQFFPLSIESGDLVTEPGVLLTPLSGRFMIGKESGVGHLRLQLGKAPFPLLDISFQFGKPFLPLPLFALVLLIFFALALALILGGRNRSL